MNAEHRKKLERELMLLQLSINTLEGKAGPVLHSDLALAVAKERIARIKKELGMAEGEAK